MAGAFNEGPAPYDSDESSDYSPPTYRTDREFEAHIEAVETSLRANHPLLPAANPRYVGNAPVPVVMTHF